MDAAIITILAVLLAAVLSGIWRVAKASDVSELRQSLEGKIDKLADDIKPLVIEAKADELLRQRAAAEKAVAAAKPQTAEAELAGDDVPVGAV